MRTPSTWQLHVAISRTGSHLLHVYYYKVILQQCEPCRRCVISLMICSYYFLGAYNISQTLHICGLLPCSPHNLPQVRRQAGSEKEIGWKRKSCAATEMGGVLRSYSRDTNSKEISQDSHGMSTWWFTPFHLSHNCGSPPPHCGSLRYVSFHRTTQSW